MTFEQWMIQVDIEVGNLTGGISVHDLSDFNSRDLYDSGESPADAAVAALEDDDLAMMFEDVWR
jgi:hypothetical protein